MYAYFYTEPFRHRPSKNLFVEITSGKIVQTSMIYISENDIAKCCLKEVY
jgi:hypothetical protein